MKAAGSIVLALILGLVSASTATAQGRRSKEEASILACLEQAAKAFEVDVLPLVLLRQVEAGTLGKTSKANDNGSYDIGPMQINSSWLPRLARIGITESMLRDDACVNAHVAAWIYKQELKATGNPAMAMARYHSPTPKHQARYLGLVRKAIEKNLANLPPPASSIALARTAP